MEPDMRLPSLYSLVVVILPVALGLGLIYLYCVDRISAIAAVAAILALGGTLAGAAFLSKVLEDNQRLRGDSWPLSR